MRIEFLNVINKFVSDYLDDIDCIRLSDIKMSKSSPNYAIMRCVGVDFDFVIIVTTETKNRYARYDVTLIPFDIPEAQISVEYDSHYNEIV